MRVKIEVTARDIKLGVKANSGQCPIARAGRRVLAVRGNWSCSAGPASFHFDMPLGGHASVSLPQKAREFINAFDEGGPTAVKPFSFVVNLPKAAVRKGLRK